MPPLGLPNLARINVEKETLPAIYSRSDSAIVDITVKKSVPVGVLIFTFSEIEIKLACAALKFLVKSSSFLTLLAGRKSLEKTTPLIALIYSSIRTTIGASSSSEEVDRERIFNYNTPQSATLPFTKIDNNENRITLSSVYNARYSNRFNLRGGGIA